MKPKVLDYIKDYKLKYVQNKVNMQVEEDFAFTTFYIQLDIGIGSPGTCPTPGAKHCGTSGEGDAKWIAARAQHDPALQEGPVVS